MAEAQRLQIRIAGLDDAAVIARISREAYAEFEGRVNPPFRALSATPEQVRLEMHKYRFVYGLALWDGSPVGHVRYRIRDGHMHISRLAVLPAYRGLGIGRRLIAWTEHEAHRLGVLHVRGEVRSALVDLLRYYRSMGFEINGTLPLAGMPHCLTVIEKWLDEQPAGSPPEPEVPEIGDEQAWQEDMAITWELLHPILATLPALRTHPWTRNSR